MSLYVGPGGTKRLGDILRAELTATWATVRFATAYAKMSGVEHTYEVLGRFASTQGRSLRATIGIDQHGTSYEALAALLDLFAPHGHEIFVCHNPRSKGAIASPTFHPKLWLFSNRINARILAGSGNLTKGGLYTNYEVGADQALDLHDRIDRHVFDSAVAVLDRWADPSFGDVQPLDDRLLNDLFAANLVLSEDEIRRASRTLSRARVLSGGRPRAASIGEAIFSGEDFAAPPTPGTPVPRRRPPAIEVARGGWTVGSSKAEQHAVPIVPKHSKFYIHLSPAAKTEIYLAQAPLRDDPAFFGLPFTGRTEPRRRGNPPQPQANPWPISDVTIYDAAGIAGSRRALPTKMWQYMEGPHANKDVRIYFNRELQRLIEDGSVCIIEREPRPGVDYAISIYAPDHPDFNQYNANCVRGLPNSSRKYGWS